VVTPYKLPLEGGKSEVKGSDLGGGLTSADVRAAARQRPVDEMLNDPLREVTRKERRSLLGISAIAMLVGWTQARVVPSKIENFGINFTVPDRSVLLWLFFGIVAYYTVTFAVYAATDALKYFHTMDEGAKTLRKQRDERDPNTLLPKGDTGAPWRLVGFVVQASLVRGVFDFIITLAIALFAMYSLWGAVHHVAPSAPSGSGTPGDYSRVEPPQGATLPGDAWKWGGNT